MATDYGRWWTCYTFCLAAAVCVCADEEPVRRRLRRLYLLGLKHWYVALLLLVYAAQLHDGGASGIVEVIRLRMLLMGR